MARGLNKAQLIGNLTRDPELKYTPSGSAVCTFSVATNREWKNDSGEKQEDVEFHRIVTWNKLAEICGQYLKKGSKVFVEGRIQTRKWQTKDGDDRYTTEVVCNEMMMLDSKGDVSGYDGSTPPDFQAGEQADSDKASKTESKSKKESSKQEDNSDEDIPF